MLERISSLPDFSMMKNKLKERRERKKMKKTFFYRVFRSITRTKQEIIDVEAKRFFFLVS